ncbi:MAG: FAD-binding oxidoreductase [Clostridium sp.]|jgi:glycine/D-amino acid oxidase-like deaminating enzyme|nr:FAD-binding oxidoreductase [Clostridium sp.]
MFDKIVIGAGLYGLYAALYCVSRGQRVLVLEQEQTAFTRATKMNQARVHMGYHYPRSLSTAIKSAGYFQRFVEDYSFCIHQEFEQVYSTSTHFSWTDAKEFAKFCVAAHIPCEEVPVNRYFQPGLCDGAFLTKEYTYDADLLRRFFLEQLVAYPGATLCFEYQVTGITRNGNRWQVQTTHHGKEDVWESSFVLNATYASVNQILRMAGDTTEDAFALKYELCEIILCQTGEALHNVGLTVMDGPFFSVMPFGKTGLHSLTAVAFTPHMSSHQQVPTFPCQDAVGNTSCSKDHLGNCNTCPARPDSAWEYMRALADKYMRDSYYLTYHSSLYAMKPILMTSEVDDSRPTVIRCTQPRSESNRVQPPTFLSVLSGKINTVYDLDPYLG